MFYFLYRTISMGSLRLSTVKFSLEFYLYLLINYPIGNFDNVATVLRREKRNEFYGDKTHDTITNFQ